MTAYHYSKTPTRDAQEHAASLSSWEQRYEQISAGRFDGWIEELRVGPAQVFQEYTTQSVLQTGRPGENAVAIGLIRAGGGATRFCGHRLDRDRAIAVTSGGEFEFVAEAGLSLMAVSVDGAYLARLAALLNGPDATLALPGPCLLDAPLERQTGLRELLGAAMQVAAARPGQLEAPAARELLAQSMSRAVLDCLAGAPRRIDLPASAAARRRIVQRAREHMRAHADEVISVPDLCEATGCSRRALQYAFKDIVQLSPVSYLRVMRLNRVRAELRAGGAGTVGDVAARWGFWHPSRFAADYRELFGELPSATRAGAPAMLARP